MSPSQSNDREEARQIELRVDVFPNPFRSKTSMEIQLPESGIVTLEVFDIIGRRVFSRTEYGQEGRLTIPVSVSARGLYLYRVTLESPVLSAQSTGTIVRW